MADTPPGETATPPVLENNPNPQSPAPAPAPAATPKPAEDSVVEQLRKEKEQAEMRANQLANQLKTREEAEAAQEAKELEDQNKFKELYEQEKAKREAIETESEKKERETALKQKEQEVLGEFNDDVIALAKDLGMDLADTDDQTVEAYKEKLTKLSTKAATTGRVGGNNPAPTGGSAMPSGDDLKLALKDDKSFDDIVKQNYPGIAMMRSPRSE